MHPHAPPVPAHTLVWTRVTNPHQVRTTQDAGEDKPTIIKSVGLVKGMGHGHRAENQAPHIGEDTEELDIYKLLQQHSCC